MLKEMYRQGDVLLLRVEEIPHDSEEILSKERIVLAYGEATGHAHAVSAAKAKLFARGEERFLLVGEGGVGLYHEEHALIPLPAGAYKLVLQREYAPDTSRLVLD